MAELIDVDSTLGAMFVGVLVGSTLWGISTAQTWHYLGAYPNDLVYIKLLVGILWATETAHQCLISHALYTYTITYFANPLSLIDLTVWTIIVQTPVEAVTTFFVQLFFTYRIWKLSERNYYITALIVCMSIAQFVVICIFTARFMAIPSLLQIQASLLPTLMPSLAGLSAATDITIAAVLCYLLSRNRPSNAGMRPPNRLLDRLIGYTLSTGILTSAFAFAHLGLYLTSPESFWYMASFFIAGRLYFNSLLASLNLRVSSANNTGGTGPADTGLSAATCDLQEQSVPAPWMERTLDSAVAPSLVMKRSVYGGSSQDASEETYKPETVNHVYRPQRLEY